MARKSRSRGIRVGRECGARLRGNARAKEMTEKARALSRPWGVLGSFWAEDLKIWDGVIRGRAWKGTLWMVPHKTDEAHIASSRMFSRQRISSTRRLPRRPISPGSIVCSLMKWDFWPSFIRVPTGLMSAADSAKAFTARLSLRSRGFPFPAGRTGRRNFRRSRFSRAGNAHRAEDSRGAHEWLSSLESAAGQRARWKEVRRPATRCVRETARANPPMGFGMEASKRA